MICISVRHFHSITASVIAATVLCVFVLLAMLTLHEDISAVGTSVLHQREIEQNSGRG